jgi:biotin operon repressor
MKRVLSVDAETGEVMDGAVLGMFFPKRQNGFRDGWIAMAQHALMELAKANLGQQTTRVLFALLAKLDFENYLLVSQAEIASELDMKRPNVSEAITSLVTLGVLLKGPKAGRSVTYRLNPQYGWKGSAQNHQKALTDRMKRSNIKAVIDGGPQPSGTA